MFYCSLPGKEEREGKGFFKEQQTRQTSNGTGKNHEWPSLAVLIIICSSGIFFLFGIRFEPPFFGGCELTLYVR